MIRIFSFTSKIIIIAVLFAAAVLSINLSFSKNDVVHELKGKVAANWDETGDADIPLYLLRNKIPASFSRVFLKNKIAVLHNEAIVRNALLIPHILRNLSHLNITGTPLYVKTRFLRL